MAINTATLRPARLARHAAALGVMAALLAMSPLSAEAASAPYMKVANTAMGTVQNVQLDINKSMIVDFPTNVGEVIVSQPSLANVIMRTKTRAIIQGMAGGETNIFFLDPAGNNISVMNIAVGQPRSDVGNALQAAINRNIKGSNIAVESVVLDGGTNRVVLSGTANSQDDLSKALAMAAQFAGDEKNVASMVTVTGAQQVNLKVTVAEVNRETVKQLGINLTGSLTIGSVDLGFTSQPSQGGASGVANSNGVSANYDDGTFALKASLRALERRGALRTLAEPTLTAMSGQQAAFDAGGEFPVPQDVGSDGKVSYTFKEFGVKLTFTPTVRSNGVIGLAVDTSVSEPTTEGAISANGITIPATKKRQATTSVELKAGQTLAIAGMLQDQLRQQVNKLPFLGNIPIIGTLFRSRDYIHSQTELVILVTPYLAAPINGSPDEVVQQFTAAGDAEAVFLGKMEKNYGVGEGGMRGSYSGSVGFVLD